MMHKNVCVCVGGGGGGLRFENLWQNLIIIILSSVPLTNGPQHCETNWLIN